MEKFLLGVHLMVGPLTFAFAASVMWLDKWKEWHHFYIGLTMYLIGMALPAGPLTIILLILGYYLLADDAFQHTVQLWEPDYLSPLHNLYVLVYNSFSKVAK